MTQLTDFLTTQWQEHTIAFLVLSSVISAFLGAAAKSLLEVLVPQALKDRRDARRLVSRLSTPLVESASQLEGRIRNFAVFGSNSWMKRSGYYRLSSYYAFAEFFGWIHILGSGLDQLRLGSRRRDRRLAATLRLVEKGFNNLAYFRFAHIEQEEIGSTGEIPKFVCRAIGELMAEGRQEPLGFAEFCRQYREDPSFRGWIDQLRSFYRKKGRARLEPHNVRHRVVQTYLGALIQVVGPRSHFERMGPDRLRAILAEIPDPYVLDMIAVDLARAGVRLGVEKRRTYLRRRTAILLGRDPHILPPRVEEVSGVIQPKNHQFDLSQGRSRAELYEWVAKQAAERALRARKRMRFSVRIEYDDSTVRPGDVARIPQNIEDYSGRRVLATHVRLRPLTPTAT